MNMNEQPTEPQRTGPLAGGYDVHFRIRLQIIKFIIPIPKVTFFPFLPAGSNQLLNIAEGIETVSLDLCCSPIH